MIILIYSWGRAMEEGFSAAVNNVISNEQILILRLFQFYTEMRFPPPSPSLFLLPLYLSPSLFLYLPPLSLPLSPCLCYTH